MGPDERARGAVRRTLLPQRLTACAALLLLGLALPVLAHARASADERHPELGLTFPGARDYEQIPIPPDEPWIVLRYAEKVAADAPKAVRPQMMFVWIDVPLEPSMAHDDARGVDGIETYFESQLSDWSLGLPALRHEREGFRALEFSMTRRDHAAQRAVVGRVFAYASPARTVALIGVCGPTDFEQHTQIWRAVFERLRISEPRAASTAAIELAYAQRPYSDVPFRIGVRKALVRGWKAQDTEHYIVVHDTSDGALIRQVCRDLELLRAEYARLFPPVREVASVAIVRVCKSAEEYRAYGGPPLTAGYWNAAAEELVLYDAGGKDGPRGDDTDTFMCLYHEAFHQYIHDSTGELPPHSWFDEGHGDYFSGASIRGGTLRGIGVNTWRVGTIQRAISDGEHVPWREIVAYEKEQYYAPDKVATCYAQGWSMIYFLRHAYEVKRQPRWARILPAYFDTLKQAYADELAALSDALGADPDARAAAGLAARRRALDAAFDGIDFESIEATWKRFVLGLQLPRR